eukprot:gene16275-19313_t
MGYPRPASIVAIAFTLFVQAEVAQSQWYGGNLYNGVTSGGVNQCFTPTAYDTNTIAREACELLYGTCWSGTCGYFQYYYPANTPSCDCATPVGVYQFIFANTGYNGVGEDYGGNMASVTANNLFTRVKEEAGCTANSWGLTLANLGASTAGCGMVADGTANVVNTQQAPAQDAAADMVADVTADVAETQQAPAQDAAAGKNTGKYTDLEF